jgi:hypothetical protein
LRFFVRESVRLFPIRRILSLPRGRLPNPWSASPSRPGFAPSTERGILRGLRKVSACVEAKNAQKRPNARSSFLRGSIQDPGD